MSNPRAIRELERLRFERLNNVKPEIETETRIKTEKKDYNRQKKKKKS